MPGAVFTRDCKGCHGHILTHLSRHIEARKPCVLASLVCSCITMRRPAWCDPTIANSRQLWATPPIGISGETARCVSRGDLFASSAASGFRAQRCTCRRGRTPLRPSGVPTCRVVRASLVHVISLGVTDVPQTSQLVGTIGSLIELGITARGRTRFRDGLVSGHDFSRAVRSWKYFGL